MERATLETAAGSGPEPAPDATPPAGGGSNRPPRAGGLPPPGTFTSATEERPGDPADPGPAWAEAAPELADWALRTVVVRTDAFGTYYRVEQPDGESRVEARTCHRELTRDLLVRHFAGATADGRVGVHLIDPEDSTCRVVVVDIDAHDSDDDPAVNRAFALQVAGRARSRGVEALVLDSDGRGGYHIWCLLGEPVDSGIAHALGKWLVRGWQGAGLAKQPESFPKSRGLTGKGYGNFIRLPGRHHKRPHRTRVWDGRSEELGRGMLAGAAAVRAILASGAGGGLTRAEPLLPPECLIEEAMRMIRPPRRALDPETLGEEAARARQALGALGPRFYDDYDGWLRVGMALRNLGDEGLAVWHEWSSSSAKYQPEVLDAKWASFAAADGPSPGVVASGLLGLATIFHLARGEGWDPARRADSGPRRPKDRRRFVIHIPIGGR